MVGILVHVSWLTHNPYLLQIKGQLKRKLKDILKHCALQNITSPSPQKHNLKIKHIFLVRFNNLKENSFSTYCISPLGFRKQVTQYLKVG